MRLYLVGLKIAIIICMNPVYFNTFGVVQSMMIVFRLRILLRFFVFLSQK